jgi:hypothetical protein
MSIAATNPIFYQILEAWIRKWEELLKEPADLLLNRTFGNIIPAASIETKPYFTKPRYIERSAKGWARGLLELLESEFREENIEILFYRLQYPQEIKELEPLLKQGKFEVAAIYPLLEKIKHGPSANTILSALRVELGSAADFDFDLFVAGSVLILQGGLSKESISSLKEKLSVSLARHGTYLAVRSLLQEMSIDELLFERMSENWKMFLDECLSFKIDSVKTGFDEGITRVFELYSWEFKAREILQRVCASIARFLTDHRAQMATAQDQVRDYAEEQLTRVLRREYSLAYLMELFEMSIGGVRHKNEYIESIGQELATVLLNSSFENKQFRHSQPYRPNPVDACCSDAFVKAIKDVARHKFSLNLDQGFDIAELDSNLLRALLQQLWDNEGFRTIDWENSTDLEVREVCEQWLASVDLQKDLAKIVTPLNPLLINAFQQFLTEPSFSDFKVWTNGDSFWEKWHENLSRLVSWNRGIFHYIPWDSFDESTIDDLFVRVTRDFEQADDSWLVVLSIHNLDPPQTPRRIAEITFYDPIRWDYGEKISFHKNSINKITSAKLNVNARTFREAKRIAAIHLREILNCVALSLSVDKARGGFKPIIDPEIFAQRLSSRGWSSDHPLGRNERPITQSFLSFEQFGPMFDFLIHASRSASATMLQQKLLKALHWYSKARSEDDPAQSLLLYWISLEHLFEEGNDDKLLTSIAALHINWRDVLSYGWYFLSRHEEEVMNKLSSDQEITEILAQHQELKNWNRDYRVLLTYENVQTVLGLIPSEKKSLADYVQGYAEYLHRFAKDKSVILRDMESLRSIYRFRLLLIKQIRNNIVHQALGYESDVALYTDELEKIFEETIVKLTNDAIRAVPQCASIADLIAQYEELWIS